MENVEVTPENEQEIMSALQGGHGELGMTIQITRAATGETETFELVGKPILTDEE